MYAFTVCLSVVLCLCVNAGAEPIVNKFAKASDLNDMVLTEEPLVSFYAKHKFHCLSKCGQDERCLAVSYNAGERWCKLYEDGTGVSTAASGWRSWRAAACSNPATLSNGIASYISKRVGSTTGYACYAGYMYNGTNLESLCTEDGTWVGLDGSCKPVAVTDCWDIKGLNPTAANGVYSILPTVGSGPISVYCDMTDNGGGWTVIQRRADGSENFYRDWTDYKNGFGNLNNEFWLGNINIRRLTYMGTSRLQIDLEDWQGDRRYASYSGFMLNDESDDFRLGVSGYTGNAGDSLTYDHGMRFSTHDNDQDLYSNFNCAAHFTGAWWYRDCGSSNMNGQYNSTAGNGVVWYHFKGSYYSMKYTAMKIRPQ